MPPEGAIGNEKDIRRPMRTANVMRALASAQYLSFAGMQNLVKDEAQSLSRMQMELAAARISAVNECFY